MSLDHQKPARWHPMDDSGVSYTLTEYIDFCGGDVGAGNKLFAEGFALPTQVHCWGNWNNVYTVKRRTYHGMVGELDYGCKRRSASEGTRTRPHIITERHPDGHPTARGFDGSWVAAT